MNENANVHAKGLVAKLNWFYSLEISQVDLYTAQSKKTDDFYLAKVLERVAAIEQQHVDNIGDKIRELGGEPTVLGDVLAPIIGQIAGKAIAQAGTIAMLQTDIALEQKAMHDYSELISRADEPDLFNLLWSNLIDEDLHTAWFSDKVRRLGGKQRP